MQLGDSAELKRLTGRAGQLQNLPTAQAGFRAPLEVVPPRQTGDWPVGLKSAVKLASSGGI